MKKNKIIIGIALVLFAFFSTTNFKTIANAATSVFLPQQGGTGTGSIPTLGQVLVANSSGVYSPVATSSLGISSGITYLAGTGLTLTGSTFSVNTAQNIITLSNLVSAGTLNTTASGFLYPTATTSLSVSSPLTVTGTFGSLIGGTNSTINCQAASGSQAGCLSSADWTTFNNKGSGTVTAVSVASANGFSGSSSGGTTPALTLATTITGLLKGNGTAISAASAGTDYQAAGNYITALTGDLTASGPGSVAGTLATVNGNVGSFTNANITVNAKGLITAAANGSASGGGISAIGPLNQTQTGATITIATTTSTTNGQTDALTVVGSTNTLTFTPSRSGTLTQAGGGTGLSTAASSTVLVGNNASGFTAMATSTLGLENPLTFSTGLTRSTNTVTVNTSQNIATLSNLTSNGFVKTSGSTGALSVDTSTYGQKAVPSIVEGAGASVIYKTISASIGDVIQIWGQQTNVGTCAGCTRTLTLGYRWNTDAATTTLQSNQTTQASGGSDEMPVALFNMITATTTNTLNLQLTNSGAAGTTTMMTLQIK